MSTVHVASEQAQCTGKRQHRTKVDAKRAARQSERLVKGQLDSYRCPWCGWFHNGHPPQQLTKR